MARPEVSIIVGIAGALLLVIIARLVPKRELLMYAVGLGITGVAYVLFALRPGVPGGYLARELAGAIIFGAFAWLGFRRWPGLLAIGWIAHVAWDLFFHYANGPGFAPGWYAMFCVGFDLPIGGYIAGLIARPTRGSNGGSQ
jgi:hypothetical protein